MTPKTGIDYISAERERQVNEEGYTIDGDMGYMFGELGMAAASYAIQEHRRALPMSKPGLNEDVPGIWPWDDRHWKPTPDDRIRELSKAGALIAAAIDVELEKKRRETESRK